MSEHSQSGHQRRPAVRPRLTWGGSALALVGMAGIGVGMTNDAGVWTWVAVAVTLVGLLLAWRGGVVYDVRAAESPKDELGEALHGKAHTGVSPRDRISHDGARHTAAVATREARTIREARIGYRPPLAPIGALVVLLVGAWLLVGRFALHYPHSSIGQAAALRDLGLGLVLFLAGLWLRQVGASRVASGLCLLSGIGLFLAGVVVIHASAVVRVDEIASGALAVVGALVSFGHRG